VAESRFCKLRGVLLVTGAVGVSACATSSSSAGAGAAVGTDASLYGSDATDAAADMDSASLDGAFAHDDGAESDALTSGSDASTLGYEDMLRSVDWDATPPCDAAPCSMFGTYCQTTVPASVTHTAESRA